MRKWSPSKKLIIEALSLAGKDTLPLQVILGSVKHTQGNHIRQAMCPLADACNWQLQLQLQLQSQVGDRLVWRCGRTSILHAAGPRALAPSPLDLLINHKLPRSPPKLTGSSAIRYHGCRERRIHALLAEANPTRQSPEPSRSTALDLKTMLVWETLSDVLALIAFDRKWTSWDGPTGKKLYQ
jgi:hypothetical protein